MHELQVDAFMLCLQQEGMHGLYRILLFLLQCELHALHQDVPLQADGILLFLP
jgi:hypothetical protein